jgi:serine/threonine protein kinase
MSLHGVLGIMHCIAGALQYLKGQNITHRDLKMANILISEGFQIKLSDFGFAKRTEENGLMETFCGTPSTMAPEQFEGNMYNDRVDVWALGVIFYQMLFKKLPFYPKGTKGTILTRMEQGLKEPLVIPPRVDITPEVRELLQKMLEKNPDKRLSIGQVVDRISELSDGHYKEEMKELYLKYEEARHEPPESPHGKTAHSSLSVSATAKLIYARLIEAGVLPHIQQMLCRLEKLDCIKAEALALKTEDSGMLAEAVGQYQVTCLNFLLQENINVSLFDKCRVELKI